MGKVLSCLPNLSPFVCQVGFGFFKINLKKISTAVSLGVKNGQTNAAELHRRQSADEELPVECKWSLSHGYLHHIRRGGVHIRCTNILMTTGLPKPGGAPLAEHSSPVQKSQSCKSVSNLL